MKKKLALLFIPVIIAVILLVSLSGCNSTTAANAVPSQQQGQQTGISVSGEGIVLALPLCDRIQSNFDVRVHSLI
jgi:uncharacterized protein YggE